MRIYSTYKRKENQVELLCFQVGKLYNYVNQKIIVKNIIKQF
ncbi:conserved protein of unknown function [Streptococcus sanguinis]|uniref:Uncharacterized protein n=1 Tax=Streptococcus sanguinis TaxID=1305 RepID=A0A0B7GR99_STRSA|nr:conserved protein of unknown function [Streptococcus sanguinis]